MATLPIPPQKVEKFSDRKGEVRACSMCKNATLPPPMHLHCRWCLASGFVAKCLPCNGTGTIVALAAWDAKSKHGSTCDSCGGFGVIPAREIEFDQWLEAHAPDEFAQYQLIKEALEDPKTAGKAMDDLALFYAGKLKDATAPEPPAASTEPAAPAAPPAPPAPTQ